MEWGLGPWRGGGCNNSSPFATDVWDPSGYGGNNWDVGRRGGGDDDTSALAHAHVDWRETDSTHIFFADLPGVRKEDLKVQVEDNNILQISGERVKEQEDKNDKWHRVERRRLVRRFRLPENANLDQISCSLLNGVLSVTVPKKETPPQQKNVKQIDVA